MSFVNCEPQKSLLCDILEAQNVDRNGKYLEAVRQYLTCLKSLSDKLLICTYSTGLQMSETSLEHVKLCVMLSERIQDIVTKQESKEVSCMGSDLYISKSSSPVDEALKSNLCLMKAHKERISKFFVGNKQYSLNMNLLLQRKMSENIAIAERHRVNLEKKRQEKMQQIIEDTEKRFLNQSCLSEFEICQKKLYCDVLKFETNDSSLDSLRTTNKECFNMEFIISLTSQILVSKSHPLKIYFQGEQFKVCFKIKEILDKTKMELDPGTVLSESFKNEAISCVRKSYQEVVKMFVFIYEQLDDIGKKTILDSCLEKHFYDSFWEFLKDLYRLYLGSTEKHLSSLMNFCKQIEFTPANVGVPENFQLVQEPIPYAEAINNFSLIPKQHPLSSKLNGLSNAFQSICQCVKQYSGAHKTELPELGADELLPVLSYCVLSSNVPSLIIECHILMDLTDDSQLMGEDGYCLASMLTALDWLSKIDVEDIKINTDSRI